MNKLPSLAFLVGLVSVVACNIETSDQPPAQAPERPASEEGSQTSDQPGVQPAPMTSDDPMAPPPQPKAGMAMVRAIHASTNAPKVDVYVKGNPTPVVTGLTYGQTSGWLEVPRGSYVLELRASPSKASDPIAYATGALQIDEGAMISAVAAGRLGTTDTDASFRILPIAETFGAMAAGKARVRAIHAGADAPSVGIDVGNDNPAAPEVASLARFADTGAAGIELPSGTRLAVGIAKDSARVTAFTTPKIPEGSQLLLIATGYLSDDSFALLGIGPNGSIGFIQQDPIVYALHAGSDAPNVDAFVGDAEVISNLAFGKLSPKMQVMPGEYTLDFFAATAGTDRPDTKAAATASTGQLEAGESYLAIATGLLANKTFTLVGVRNAFTAQDDKAVLRLIHGSPDAPAVDTGLVANGSLSPVLFPDLAYTKSSNESGLAASAGHLSIGVTPAGQTSTIVRQFTFPAIEGQRDLVVAAGVLDPMKGKSFRLLVVDTAKTPWAVSTVFAH
jgi:hypothetical protein